MIMLEEMLRIAEMLESPKANFRNGECMVHPTLFHASRLLRSIAAEREADAIQVDEIAKTIAELKASMVRNRWIAE